MQVLREVLLIMAVITFPCVIYKPRILFVTTPADWRDQCEWYNADCPYPRDGLAAVARLLCEGHSPVLMVAANIARLHREPRSIAAEVCAHEATHLMRYICDNIGERFMGWEAEAHLVGALSKWLWEIIIGGKRK